MVKVTIGANEYDSYADVAYADIYLAGDMARSPIWSGLTADLKPVALVSATRLLYRQVWRDGPPDYDNPPEVVKQVTAMLAADISNKPASGDGAGGGSNVKEVGAGSARVVFFGPVASTGDLPASILSMLGGLLGEDDADLGLATDSTAYGSNDCQQSRFDRTDYGMLGDGVRPVDRSEELYG